MQNHQKTLGFPAPWGQQDAVPAVGTTAPELRCFMPFLPGVCLLRAASPCGNLGRLLPFCVDLLPKSCFSEVLFCFPDNSQDPLWKGHRPRSGQEVVCREGGKERTLGWCLVTD